MGGEDGGGVAVPEAGAGPLGFSDLAAGEAFDFAWGTFRVQDAALAPRGGPYIKVSARRYRYADDARHAAAGGRNMELGGGFKPVVRVAWPPVEAQAAREGGVAS